MKDHKPSATAQFVATGVFYTATHPRLGIEVPKQMAELNERMLQTGTQIDLRGQFGRGWVRWRSGVLQRFAVPGFYLHFVLRKRWIETLAREAIDRGTSQVVILGAGLDTLSLRLAETNPECTFLEVDLPGFSRETLSHFWPSWPRMRSAIDSRARSGVDGDCRSRRCNGQWLSRPAAGSGSWFATPAPI